MTQSLLRMSSTVKTRNGKLEEIYEWIDELSGKIPFSRPKKNFARDFSDGGMKNNHFIS